MSLNLDKSNWKRIAFGDVVKNVNVSVMDPLAEGIERTIAMEHLEPGELAIARWGDVLDGTNFTRRVRPGQTLFGKRRSYQRKVAYADFDAVTSGDILVFEADESQLVPDLLPFLVQSEGFFQHAIETSAGSLSPRTNWRDLARFDFILPSDLAEQQRLAGLLLAVWNYGHDRARTRTLLASAYEAWLPERLSEFRTVALGEIARFQNGKAISSSNYGAGSFPLLRPGDMRSDGVTEWSSSSVRVPEELAAKYPEWVLKPGDLVINMTAQSLEDRFLGRACRMHDTALLNQRIGRLRSEEVEPEFLFAALSSKTFSDWVERRSEGSKVKHMHWRHIEDFPLPFPDQTERHSVIAECQTWRTSLVAADADLKSVSRLRAQVSKVIFGGNQ